MVVLAEAPGPGPGETGEVADLLAAAARGEEAAWREVVERYGRRVYALAKSRCRRADVAEEVTQSVFVTVAEKLGRGGYVERGRFESWLFRVTMNRVRDEMRRQKRQAAPEPTEGVEGPAEVREPSPWSGALASLRSALEGLGDADREVIELRHHAGMSFKAMAELLGEPIGTLLARHHRALRKIKDLMRLEAEGGGAGGEGRPSVETTR